MWNSKKWRFLYIVDKDFIISIKEYPYHNQFLNTQVVKELAKLRGWGNVEPVEYDFARTREEGANIIHNRKVTLNFYAGAMYNDFGSGHHYFVMSPDLECEEYVNTNYYYSGDSECMWCGDITNSIYHGDLTCKKCYNYTVCEECGEPIRNGEYYHADGATICEYCYDNCTDYDAVTEECHIKSNMYHIYLSIS